MSEGEPVNDPHPGWDMQPTGLMIFRRGMYAGEEIVTVNTQVNLDLSSAVGLFARQLPLTPGRWVIIGNQVSDNSEPLYRILCGNWQPDWAAPRWDGCKVAFDLLRTMWSPEDVDWWATSVENYEMYALLEQLESE